jgi:hypothetical protein
LLFSFENLYRQYHLCRRNKRNTLNALRFEARQEENLLALREALINHTYIPSRSVCFFAPGPKLREIFAADFRDRVVHHVLVDYLERIWEPLFIHDSYACRRGRGVHAAVKRLQKFIRQATVNGTRRAWYLQLDIQNYFMSIDRDILFAQVWRSIWRSHPWLAQYFNFDRDARKFTRLYKTPRSFRRVRQQYLYYSWRFAGDVVLFQVGRFFEFYAKADDEIARRLALAPMGWNSRRAQYGFPVPAAGRYLGKLLRSGRSVALIVESNVYVTGVRLRLPAWRFERCLRS